MRWPVKDRPNTLYWHLWFAWHPIRVSHEWVWWEPVARRVVSSYVGDTWEYANKEILD